MKGTTSAGNCYVLCRPFIFQGHVGGGGGNKDLPENSGLDHAGRTTVWFVCLSLRAVTLHQNSCVL